MRIPVAPFFKYSLSEASLMTRFKRLEWDDALRIRSTRAWLTSLPQRNSRIIDSPSSIALSIFRATAEDLNLEASITVTLILHPCIHPQKVRQYKKTTYGLMDSSFLPGVRGTSQKTARSLPSKSTRWYDLCSVRPQDRHQQFKSTALGEGGSKPYSRQSRNTPAKAEGWHQGCIPGLSKIHLSFGQKLLSLELLKFLLRQSAWKNVAGKAN